MSVHFIMWSFTIYRGLEWIINWVQLLLDMKCCGKLWESSLSDNSRPMASITEDFIGIFKIKL